MQDFILREETSKLLTSREDDVPESIELENCISVLLANVYSEFANRIRGFCASTLNKILLYRVAILENTFGAVSFRNRVEQ